jgi:hypothetical protein
MILQLISESTNRSALLTQEGQESRNLLEAEFQKLRVNTQAALGELQGQSLALQHVAISASKATNAELNTMFAEDKLEDKANSAVKRLINSLWFPK